MNECIVVNGARREGSVLKLTENSLSWREGEEDVHRLCDEIHPGELEYTR